MYSTVLALTPRMDATPCFFAMDAASLGACCLYERYIDVIDLGYSVLWVMIVSISRHVEC